MTSTLLQQAVEAALHRAFHLGQTYWMYADSESVIQHRKVDVVQATFNTLVEETVSALQQQPEPVALSDRQIKAIARQWFVTGENQLRADGYYYRSMGTVTNVRESDLIAFAREVLTRAEAWPAIREAIARELVAPPALQQQEEPREVAAENDAFNEWWESSGQGAEPLHTLTTENCARATWHERARRAASPSPQDFTLPMVEEAKGTGLSEFVRNATPERKAEVYGRVMDAAAEKQQAVIDAAGLPAVATPSREHRELMLLAAADLESWMKSYHRDGATEDTVKRLRDAAHGVNAPGEGQQ